MSDSRPTLSRFSTAFHVVTGTQKDIFLGIEFIEDEGLSLVGVWKTLYFSQSDWQNDEVSFVSVLNVSVPANSLKCIKVKAFNEPDIPIFGPYAVVLAVDCTRAPILGKDGLCTIDRNGFSHIITDNPSDTVVEILKSGIYCFN